MQYYQCESYLRTLLLLITFDITTEGNVKSEFPLLIHPCTEHFLDLFATFFDVFFCLFAVSVTTVSSPPSKQKVKGMRYENRIFSIHPSILLDCIQSFYLQ